MATKKAGKEMAGKRRRRLLEDPPIVVGGGSSTLILIRKDFRTEIVSPPAAFANYFCLKCDINIKKIRANDGIGGAGHGDVSPPGDGLGEVHPTRHKTVFE